MWWLTPTPSCSEWTDTSLNTKITIDQCTAKPSRGWFCLGRASNTWSRSATSSRGGSFLANQTHRWTEKLASLTLTAKVLQPQQATCTQLVLGLTCKLHVIVEAYPLWLNSDLLLFPCIFSKIVHQDSVNPSLYLSVYFHR